uniref:Uncharacterized protein n=1 Tax=Mola mola TaxID=94237 RepID=A0A3Q3WES4_MOLML
MSAIRKKAGSNGNQEGSWYSAIYVGVVFSLSKRDRRKMVMEEKMLPYLEEKSGKTFFGVFSL